MAARQRDFQLIVDDRSRIPLVDVLDFEHQRVVAIGRGEVPVRSKEADVEALTSLALPGDDEHLACGRRILRRPRGNERKRLVKEDRLREWRQGDELAARKKREGPTGNTAL